MAATIVDVVATAVLGLGLLAATVGLYGMLRMPEVFSQLHAAGLITGPAVVLVLLASVATGNAEIITSAVLVLLFVLVTSPLSGHAIAQAAHRRGEDVSDPPAPSAGPSRPPVDPRP
jgi:monovalent cation/proton antiporter MnhG/PhaG subunit